jgi:SpoIID/LytB domain protein
LRAQAVAARSELLTDLGVRHLADPWMTCSDQRCQVYRGITIEDARTSAAVLDTRGQVLTDGDQIIKAYFSSNNGGFAGSNATTWGEEQRTYLIARADTVDVATEWQDGLNSEEEVRDFIERSPDAYSAISSFASGRNFRWETTLTAAEVTAAVRSRADVGDVTDLQVVERDQSGRITRLRVVGTERERIVERELNVRRALGGLRSALFVMNISQNSQGHLTSVTFAGAGFGHGVGLCQSGAIGAAERGMEWQDILAHYYPGTTLRALY